MSYTLQMDQQDFLDRAEAHMLSNGYSVESRTGVSVNFERRAPMGCAMQLAALGMVVFTGGLGLLALPLLFMLKQKVNVTAIEREGALSVNTGGEATACCAELEAWIEEEFGVTFTGPTRQELAAPKPVYTGAGLYRNGSTVAENSLMSFGDYKSQIGMNGKDMLHVYEHGLLLYRGIFKQVLVGSLPGNRVAIEAYDTGVGRKITVKDTLTGEVFSGPADVFIGQANKLIHGY